MNILITGSSGQLGSDCFKVLNEKHDLTSTDLKKTVTVNQELDITRYEAVDEIVNRIAPEIIINCAAYTNVDACETEEETAYKINAQGPKNLANALSKYGGKLIHISTDYVFSGKKPSGEAYLESDETGPLSAYGRTKLEGEKAVRDHLQSHIIVRTAWLYGINGHNFLKTMLRLSTNNPGQQIKVVNDQVGSPTWTYRLAQQIGRLIDSGSKGTYHGTSEGSCTWYDLAAYFLEKMGVGHTIIPCSTEEYPLPAVRPGNSILENERFKKENINCMVDWKDDIDQFVKDYKERLIAEVE